MNKASLLQLANRVRAGAPVALGVRDTTVTLRKRVWSGGARGEGSRVDSDTVLTPPPHVRQLSTREVSQSGGRFEIGDVRIGPITPKFAGGGYSKEELSPTSTEDGTEYFYVLAGTEVSGEYAPSEVDTTKGAVSFYVVAKRRIG